MVSNISHSLVSIILHFGSFMPYPLVHNISYLLVVTFFLFSSLRLIPSSYRGRLPSFHGLLPSSPRGLLPSSSRGLLPSSPLLPSSTVLSRGPLYFPLFSVLRSSLTFLPSFLVLCSPEFQIFWSYISHFLVLLVPTILRFLVSYIFLFLVSYIFHFLFSYIRLFSFTGLHDFISFFTPRSSSLFIPRSSSFSISPSSSFFTSRPPSFFSRSFLRSRKRSWFDFHVPSLL